MDGWIVAGALASFGTVVIAAAALVFSIRAEQRERERRPLSSVSLEPNLSTLNRAGEVVTIECELVNEGDEHVNLVELAGRHCQFMKDEQTGPVVSVRHIDRGGSGWVQLVMSPADVDRAWVVMRWTPPGKSGSFVRWTPARTDGPLAEDLIRRYEQWKAWLRWRRLANRLRHRRTRRLVGPGRLLHRFVPARELRKLSLPGTTWVEHFAPLETPERVPLRRRLLRRRSGSVEVAAEDEG